MVCAMRCLLERRTYPLAPLPSREGEWREGGDETRAPTRDAPTGLAGVCLDSRLRGNDGHGAGGAREGCRRRQPVPAVEQDRGRGGDWMAGCT